MSTPDANGWLPIETAPDDQRSILGCHASSKIQHVTWRYPLAPPPQASGGIMTHPDHIADDLRASEALFEGRADLKVLLQRSVLIAALENVAKFETDPSLKAAARARFLDLTDGKENS